MSKARTSLTNTQRQLYDYDAENYQLKEKSLSLETKLKERHEEVDQLTHQLEKNNIEHSNLLTERDRQIARMSAQTAESADNSGVELPEIWDREGGLQSVVSDIQSLSTSLLACHNCKTDQTSTRLAEAASQLQFLTRVIYNEGPHDIYRCPSEDNILGIEVEEKLSPEEALLETQLTELTSKLDRMESEMCLVSEESKNLQQALEIKDSVIVDQVSTALSNRITICTITQHTTPHIILAPAALRALPAGLHSGAAGSLPPVCRQERDPTRPLQGKNGIECTLSGH